MLERIMNLQILLCIMAAAELSERLACWQYTLLTEELCEEQMQSQSLKEKWTEPLETRDKLLNKMNFLVWLPSLL